MNCMTSTAKRSAAQPSVSDVELDAFALADLAARWPRLAMGFLYHRTNTGRELAFVDRDWLRALYQDAADYIVIQKAAQVGLTEFALCAMMDYAARGLSGLYILPTDTWRNLFVANRIDGMLRASAFYRDHAKAAPRDSDSRALKNLFGAPWKFVGSQQANQFFEFPADRLIIDEHDRCHRKNLVYSLDRLRASLSPGILKFGNPTQIGRGINEAYLESDQHVWLVKCPRCGEWQELKWEAHFVRQDDGGRWLLRDGNIGADQISPPLGGHPDVHGQAQCVRCAGFFSRLTPGEWVPQRLGPIVWRGYKVSQLFGDVRRDHPVIGELFAEWVASEGDATRRQRFVNNVLGEPFKDSGSSFTWNTLRFCAQDYLMPEASDNSYAGVDVGAKLHVHIEELTDTVPRKVFVGSVPSWDELQQVTSRYNVRRGVVDREPEHHAALEWCRTHGGWYTCTYTSNRSTTDLVTRPDHKARRIVVDRTASLDAAFARWAQGGVQVPKNFESLDNGDFAPQMIAAVRRWDEARARYVWDDAGQADHHQHADHYCFLAGSMFARGAII